MRMDVSGLKQNAIGIEGRRSFREDTKLKNRNLVLVGWILFTMSALGYIVASFGDFWAMFGSVCFLVACLVFLLAHFRGTP